MTTRISKVRASFATALMLFGGGAGASEAYTLPTTVTSADLPPIAMTYRDLDRVLEQIRGLVATANRAEEADTLDVPALRITVGTAGREQIFRGWVTLNGLESLPETSFSFSLYYSSVSAPIERVEISLNDWSRIIRVEGRDITQVDALTALVSRELRSHRKYFAGPSARTFFGIVSNLAAVMIAFMIWRWRVQRNPAVDTSRNFIITLGLAMLAYLTLMAVVPSREIFPGFAAHSDTASFLIRSAPLVTFLGLMVSIVLPLALTWMSRSERGNQVSSSS